MILLLRRRMVEVMFGGKIMDTFMDKLASKLNAQEMIRANSAAEAAENAKLKQEVEAYRECLQEMREICLQNASTGDEVSELVRASMDKISEIQAESGKTEEVLLAMQNSSNEVMSAVQNNSDNVMSAMRNNSDAVLRAMQSSSDTMMSMMQNTLQTNSDAMLSEVRTVNDELKNSMKDELLAEIKRELKNQEENVHKECVKVYRNVQAVITEENEKQTNAIIENQTKIKKRATAALVCGILAMSFSALGLVVSILNVVGVFNLVF